jgi:hypothetical protein
MRVVSLEDIASAVAGALIGDAQDEDFSQGHFVHVIGRRTGGWGMKESVEAAALDCGRPASRPAESCQLLNFRFVAGYGGSSFGDYVVDTGVDADSAAWVLIQVGALAGTLAAGEIKRLIEEESADRDGVDLALAANGREPACAVRIGKQFNDFIPVERGGVSDGGLGLLIWIFDHDFCFGFVMTHVLLLHRLNLPHQDNAADSAGGNFRLG